jgi:pilus assembly protein FimV
MTPAPPPPPKDDADVRDVLNEPAVDSEGFDLDSVDADFEQELEDLFADDLEDTPVPDESGGPVVLDDEVEAEKNAPVGEELLVLDDVVEEPAAAESAPEAEDLLVLDDVAEEPAEEVDDESELIVLDEVVELVEKADAAEGGAQAVTATEAVVTDLELPAEEDDEEDEEIINLDDLVEEPVSYESQEAEQAEELEEEPLIDLDDLLGEESLAEPETEIYESGTEPVRDDEAEGGFEDAPAVEEPLAEPVDEAVPAGEAMTGDIPVEELDAVMDEPEEARSAEDEVFASAADDLPSAEPMDAELTGLEELGDDDIEDVDSLLDNVEVDVSDVVDTEAVDAELDDDMVMDLDEGSLDEVLAAESEPSDVDMDEEPGLLPIIPAGEGEPTLAELQAKVRQLEGRVEELELRLRDEIAQMVPAEAARIIREEIAALTADFDE